MQNMQKQSLSNETLEIKEHYQNIIQKLIIDYLNSNKNENELELLVALLLPHQESPEHSTLLTIQNFLAIPEWHTFVRDFIIQQITNRYRDLHGTIKELETKFPAIKDFKLSTFLEWGRRINLEEKKHLCLNGAIGINDYYFYLGKITIDKWYAFCEAIKISGLKSLDLEFTGLKNLLPIQWISLFNAIKICQIESLDLSVNFLNELDSQSWNSLNEGLKIAKLRLLKIDSDTIQLLEPKRRLDLIESMKISGTGILDLTIYLDECNFEIISDFIDMLGVTDIKLNISPIHISCTRQNPVSQQLLNFSQILVQARQDKLILTGNALWHFTEELHAIKECIKIAGIRILDLSDTYLGVSTDNEMWEAICQILCLPELKEVDLSCNKLNKIPTDIWQNLCTAISASSIQSLNLSRNYLGKRNYEEWVILGKAIGKLIELDISFFPKDDICDFIMEPKFFGALTTGNAKIQSLKVNNFKFQLTQKEYGEAFYEMIKIFGTVKLNIANNSFQNENLIKIQEIIDKNITQRFLTMEHQNGLQNLILYTFWKNENKGKWQFSSTNSKLPTDLINKHNQLPKYYGFSTFSSPAKSSNKTKTNEENYYKTGYYL